MLCDVLYDAVQKRRWPMLALDNRAWMQEGGAPVRIAALDSLDAKARCMCSRQATSAPPAISVSIELAPQLLSMPVRLR
jgi:hypothetical protein